MHGRILHHMGSVFLAAALGAASGQVEAQPQSPRPPNVLFLLADDLRANAVGALGNPVVKTPNLDALVRSGFIFRNAYCLGSNIQAVCLPSRSMILSGRAYFRWPGVWAPGDPPNFPLSLRAAGFDTYHHGKWSNSPIEIQQRFEHNHYIDEDRERLSGQPGKAIVDEAIRFLQTRRRDRPFFMYLGFEAPHDPRVADRAYLDQYDRRTIPLPANFLPVHPFDNGAMTVRDELLAPWPRTDPELRRHLHEYYAVITGLDFHIGRLVRRLQELGELDRTIIVFSSDHGLAVGSHGLMGKQNLYEHSMKAPLVFAGPQIRRGQSDALVYLMDIYPTICDLVGARVPDRLDGRSLARVIAGQAPDGSIRDSVFLALGNVQRAVRDERWKLIRYPQINLVQLFDLHVDPDEKHSLADDPAQRSCIEHLTELMRDWQHWMGDPLPLTFKNPRSRTFTPPTGAELEELKRQ
jgi:arylsulfatase A-like enzyme